MTDDLADLLNNLPPEVLDQLLNLGIAGDQGGILDQQIQQAQALRKPSGVPHTTGAGAALGAFADTLNAGAGGVREAQLRKQQQELLAQQVAGRKALLETLRRQQPMPQGAGDFSAPSRPFAFG